MGSPPPSYPLDIQTTGWGELARSPRFCRIVLFETDDPMAGPNFLDPNGPWEIADFGLRWPGEDQVTFRYHVSGSGYDLYFVAVMFDASPPNGVIATSRVLHVRD